MAGIDSGTTPTSGIDPEMRSANAFDISGTPLIAAKSARAFAALSGKLQR
jgi:hypothetical protein